MDDFSSQLGMIKYSEIRHFSMKFPSEGEFWHCQFTGCKMGASSPDVSGQIGVRKQENLKVRHSVPTTVSIVTGPVLVIILLKHFLTPSR